MNLKGYPRFRKEVGTSRNSNAIFDKFKLLDEPLGRYEKCKARDLYLIKCLQFPSE